MDNLPVIAIRFALYADLLVLTGLVAFSFYALTREERAAGILPLMYPAALLSILGLFLSGIGMVALVAGMMGSSLIAIDTEVLQSLVTESSIGMAWLVRMASMVGAIMFALLLARSPTVARLGLLASVSLAVATLVWTGHAGATEGSFGWVHRVSDIVHMMAASIWLGGIAAFIWLLFVPLARRSPMTLTITHRALEQFSRVGGMCVALIIATGVINSLILVGPSNFLVLPRTPYGLLLIAKIALFGVMLLLAASNRWRLTPMLSAVLNERSEMSAVRKLKISLLTEGLAALAVLALVAWLGTLEPTSALA